MSRKDFRCHCRILVPDASGQVDNCKTVKGIVCATRRRDERRTAILRASAAGTSASSRRIVQRFVN